MHSVVSRRLRCHKQRLRLHEERSFVTEGACDGRSFAVFAVEEEIYG